MTEDFTKLFQKMMEQGQDMARAFVPSFEGMNAKGLESLFPAMPKEWQEAWFGKTFNPEGLDARTRMLVTLAALTVQGALAEPQLKATIRNALAAGATQREVAEVILQMSMFGGLPAAQKAGAIAAEVFSETKETKA